MAARCSKGELQRQKDLNMDLRQALDGCRYEFEQLLLGGDAAHHATRGIADINQTIGGRG